MYKIFLLGLCIGTTITWSYFDNNDIAIGAVFGIIAWYLKVHYEKWQTNRKAIAKLQRVASLNHSTLRGHLDFLNEWKQAIENKTFYASYPEYFQLPEEADIDALNNITVLNAVIPLFLQMKRYNNDLLHLWSHYVCSRDEIFKKIDIESNTKKIDCLLPTLNEMLIKVKADIIKTLEVLALLRVAGNKTDRSLFKKISILANYQISDKEIDAAYQELEIEIKNKGINV